MSVLSLLKKVKVQTLSFEKHPCRELDQEVMVHYLNGLALITNEDENVCEKEREYLSILINSFRLNEDILETFVNFAENPDEKLILDMMQSFMTKDIKYNFMVDAMMIASIDGNFDESEEAIIEQYFEMFKITKKEAEDLRYIYEMFYTQNGNALYRYFAIKNKSATYIIKPELFQYLIEYYEIDMVYELQEEEKKLLEFEFFKPTFEYGKLGKNATEIMTKPVSNAQFCIYLNAKYVNKKIEVDGNGKIVDSESKDLLMDMDNNNIYLEDKKFTVDRDKYEEKITGVTLVAGKDFISWASEVNDIRYIISIFVSGNYGRFSVDSFNDNPVSFEFFWSPDHSSFRIARRKKSKYFDTYEDTKSVDENYNSKKSSFRMMKLASERNESTLVGNII